MLVLDCKCLLWLAHSWNADAEENINGGGGVVAHLQLPCQVRSPFTGTALHKLPPMAQPPTWFPPRCPSGWQLEGRHKLFFSWQSSQKSGTSILEMKPGKVVCRQKQVPDSSLLCALCKRNLWTFSKQTHIQPKNFFCVAKLLKPAKKFLVFFCVLRLWRRH